MDDNTNDDVLIIPEGVDICDNALVSKLCGSDNRTGFTSVKFPKSFRRF